MQFYFKKSYRNFKNSIKNPGQIPVKFHDFDRDRDSKNRPILTGTGTRPGSRSILAKDRPGLLFQPGPGPGSVKSAGTGILPGPGL